MATQIVGETEKAVNKTGGALTGRRLVAIEGFDTNSRQQQIVLACANGSHRCADGFLDKSVNNNASTYFRRDYILEGTAANPVNTFGAAIGADVYLSPTVPGQWTLTKPSAENQDVQRVGTVLTPHATLGRIRFSLQAGGTNAQVPGDISSAMLNDRPHYDIGRTGFGWFRLTGTVAAGERVTTGTRVYEFTAAGVPSPGTDVAINMGGLGPWAAAASIAALVAGINADVSRVVDAWDAGGDIAGFLGRTTGTSTNYALVTTCVNGVVSAALMTGARAKGRQIFQVVRYTITAADVAALASVLGTAQIPVASFADTNGPDFVSLISARRPGVGIGGFLTYAPIALYGTDVQVVQNAALGYYGLFYREPAAGALLVAGDELVIMLHRNPGTP